jgi:hypothetical protein
VGGFVLSIAGEDRAPEKEQVPGTYSTQGNPQPQAEQMGTAGQPDKIPDRSRVEHIFGVLAQRVGNLITPALVDMYSHEEWWDPGKIIFQGSP